MILGESKICVQLENSLREVIGSINSNQKGIALVVNTEGRLLGTITDGDVRRALLAGNDLDSKIKDLRTCEACFYNCCPVTAPFGTEGPELLKMMQGNTVRQIPLVDDKGCVAGLVTLDELLPSQRLSLQAVIMGGGFGKRLHPLTEKVPKPMLPVGDRPLMELIVKQLRESGVRRINITTHYMPEKIMKHFGSGKDFGVELNYVTEDQPLGTAGSLSLMQKPEEPLLVINGDILTHVDFRALLAYHHEHKAAMTVAVRKYDLNVPYGVVECEGALIKSMKEKPLFSFYVNAGIYLLEPFVHRYIPRDKRFDMTDLIQCLLDEGLPVASFPVLEYWLDIGEHIDYEKAQEDVKNGRFIS